jgi:hypothetical protein
MSQKNKGVGGKGNIGGGQRFWRIARFMRTAKEEYCWRALPVGFREEALTAPSLTSYG